MKIPIQKAYFRVSPITHLSFLPTRYDLAKLQLLASQHVVLVVGTEQREGIGGSESVG